MPKFQLKEISVLGVVKLDDTQIKQFVSDDISKNKNLFGIIPASSTIFISETKLEKALVGQYPRIESVEVRNSLSGKLEVEIVERLGMAMWCTTETIKSDSSTTVSASSTLSIEGATSTDEVIEVKEDEESSATPTETNSEFAGCYEFDKNGYVFDKIILDRGMAFSGDTSSDSASVTGEEPDLMLNKGANQSAEFRGIIEGNPIGQRFLDEEKFNSLLKIVQFINTIDLKDEYVSCETSDLCTIKIAHNGVIHIDISHDIDDLIDRLKAVFASKALHGVQFKYVDARYSNKVFYK